MNQSMRDETLSPARRGTNQAGMRAFNERLVLTLVRAHGPLAKTDIARMTGLSAQTVSVIMRALEAEHLLRRGEPQRGRVGQPSVPLSLEPDGAYFIGVKIGRRGLDLVLVDFAGNLRLEESEAYPYPTPSRAIATIRAGVRSCERLLGRRSDRIAGIGLAMPFLLWQWAEAVGAPPEELDLWRQVDLRAELANLLPYPVYLQNDATAACGAELVFGQHAGLRDFIYFYVGAFIGGGLVLDGGLYTGRSGNAAAIGSMPVPRPGGGTEQLIHQASLVVLERRLRAAGIEPEPLYDPAADWSGFGAHLDAWLDQAARGIAAAVAAVGAVIDIEAAVIDGAIPPSIQTRLVEGVRARLGETDLSGIQPPRIEPGGIGPAARALGGASLPLFDRYLVEQHRLASIRADPSIVR
ncbi:ROK family transcriptional regulator [Amaricoccus solimangrovi]|uniref:ROK family transcriptional regulator n=1 Tax=Amaricoccus solimangrovi TaxID=2589815 RepID=A0A501WUX4_9RHOB|nr:ROK family transcriptional regulator [Amaricoccus solimangrovi]TPE53208.1 ROK family transcriptional regulator [Amaricoccus solimangrovi]